MPCSGQSINRPELYVTTLIANMGYNWKANVYHKHSGKLNICTNDFNHKYLMAFKWSQTVDTLRPTDMQAVPILIEKHTNIDTDTVEWIHHIDIVAKSNSDYNPTWDEAISGPHKEGYWLS